MAESIPEFVEIDGNPRPSDLTGGFFTTRDGTRLRYALARPPSSGRGTVLVLVGRNENIEKYFETIGDLTARGFGVAIFDWRGQGGSDRRLRDPAAGYIDRIGTYVSDLKSFVEGVLLRDCRPPFSILAHSMGGLIALAAVPHLVERIERMVLTAPLVSLRHYPRGRGLLPAAARIARWVGLGRVAPPSMRRRGRQPIERNVLTSDPVRADRNHRLLEAAPQLFVPKLTAGWLHACFREMRRLDDSDVIAKLNLPTLIITAGDDQVVHSSAAERLAWRMRSGHFLSIPGARHELLQERDVHRELLLAAFEGFVASTMPLSSDLAPEEAVAAELEALKEVIDERGEAALGR